TLDTVGPDLSITTPTANAAIAAGAGLTGTVSGTGSSVTSLSYALDGGQPVPVAFDPAQPGEFDQPLDLSRLAPGSHTLTVAARDAAGNGASRAVTVTMAAPVPLAVTG